MPAADIVVVMEHYTQCKHRSQREASSCFPPARPIHIDTLFSLQNQPGCLNHCWWASVCCSVCGQVAYRWIAL